MYDVGQTLTRRRPSLKKRRGEGCGEGGRVRKIFGSNRPQQGKERGGKADGEKNIYIHIYFGGAVLNLLPHFPPSQTDPSSQKYCTAPNHHTTTKNLQGRIIPIAALIQLTPNRRSRQGSKRNDSKHCPRAHPNLSNIRNLSDKGGREGYKGTRGESIQDGEDDDGSVGAGGDPETEDEKGGGVRSYNHCVEAA